MLLLLYYESSFPINFVLIVKFLATYSYTCIPLIVICESHACNIQSFVKKFLGCHPSFFLNYAEVNSKCYRLLWVVFQLIALLSNQWWLLSLMNHAYMGVTLKMPLPIHLDPKWTHTWQLMTHSMPNGMNRLLENPLINHMSSHQESPSRPPRIRTTLGNTHEQSPPVTWVRLQNYHTLLHHVYCKVWRQTSLSAPTGWWLCPRMH